MIRKLTRFAYYCRYGVRGGLRPPLGPYNTVFKKYRHTMWRLESRIYKWSGLPEKWHTYYEGKPYNRSNLICWMFGHKVDSYESGYEVCGRCVKHEYHDSETWYNAGNLRLDRWVKNRAYERRQRIEHKQAMEAIERGEPPF